MTIQCWSWLIKYFLFCSDCPEVSAELGVVHSGPGHTASLSCIVASDPPANVRSVDLAEYKYETFLTTDPRWYRRSLLLESDNNFLIESRGTLHTFIIRTVDTQHFGNYRCLASNSLGREVAEIQLTGETPITFLHPTLATAISDSCVLRVTQSSSVPERNPERYEWQSQADLADRIFLRNPGIQAQVQENYGRNYIVLR